MVLQLNYGKENKSFLILEILKKSKLKSNATKLLPNVSKQTYAVGKSWPQQFVKKHGYYNTVLLEVQAYRVGQSIQDTTVAHIHIYIYIHIHIYIRYYSST